MDNIIIRNRKEEFKELVLYTFFGNMTFVISIGSYAIFNVFFGINELIANALLFFFHMLPTRSGCLRLQRPPRRHF